MGGSSFAFYRSLQQICRCSVAAAKCGIMLVNQPHYFSLWAVLLYCSNWNPLRHPLTVTTIEWSFPARRTPETKQHQQCCTTSEIWYKKIICNACSNIAFGKLIQIDWPSFNASFNNFLKFTEMLATSCICFLNSASRESWQAFRSSFWNKKRYCKQERNFLTMCFLTAHHGQKFKFSGYICPVYA